MLWVGRIQSNQGRTCQGPQISMFSIDTFTKFGQDGGQAVVKALGAMSSGFQTATTESVDFMKKSFEDGQAATQQLMGARTLDVAMQVQGDYAKKAYEGFVAQTAKMGQLAVTTAKETTAPFEGLVKAA